MADLILNFKYSENTVTRIKISGWNEDTDKIFYSWNRYVAKWKKGFFDILTKYITPSTPLLNLGMMMDIYCPTDSNTNAQGFLENLSTDKEYTINGNANNGGIGFIFIREGVESFDVGGMVGTTNLLSQTTSTAEVAQDGNYFITPNLTKGDGFVMNCPIASSNQIQSITFGNKEGELAITIPKPKDVEIVQELENCTCDTQTVAVGEAKKIILTANDGYQFDETPKISINGSDFDFTVKSSKLNAWYDYTANSGDVVKITAKADEIPLAPEVIDISASLENCTVNRRSVEVGESVLLVISPEDGFELDGIPTITVNGATDFFNIVGTEAQFNYTAKSGDVVSVYGKAKEIEVIPETKTASISAELSNVTMSPSVSEFVEGSDLTLTLSIADGFEWEETPIFETNAFNGSVEIALFKKQGNDYVYTVPKSPFYDLVVSPYIRVIANAIPVTEVKNKYGICTLYKPTAEDMIELSKKRFINIASGEVYDLGQYITSLKSIPLDVPTTTSGDIRLGNTDTDINAPIVDNDEITLDLGVIEVKGKYGNALDSEGVTVEAVLPYIGIVELDASKCVNKSIAVKYRVNLISGDCVALVYLQSQGGEILLNASNGTIGFDVPYILKGENVQVMQNADGALLFTETPIVNVYQRLKANEDEDTYRTRYISLVGDLLGYNKASRIVSVSNEGVIMSDEMAEIERILKEGFICPKEK